MNTMSLLPEPDLSSRIAEGHKTTWGEKKTFCGLEGRTAYQEGGSVNDNPYIDGTWSHKWWEQAFNECED